MNALKKILTAVIDTNLFVRGIVFRRGYTFALLEALRRGEFALILSEGLEAEYREVLRTLARISWTFRGAIPAPGRCSNVNVNLAKVLSRPKFAQKYGLTEEDRAEFFYLIARRGRRISPASTLPVQVRDVKDEMVLAAALGGRADYLVTSDEDLLVLADEPALGALRIVTVEFFLAQLP